MKDEYSKSSLPNPTKSMNRNKVVPTGTSQSLFNFLDVMLPSNEPRIPFMRHAKHRSDTHKA
jgi:hypothetical protein